MRQMRLRRHTEGSLGVGVWRLQRQPAGALAITILLIIADDAIVPKTLLASIMGLGCHHL